MDSEYGSGWLEVQRPDARASYSARDGARVPVSIVYRRGTALDGTAPTLVYGYGAYGLSLDPNFSSSRLALLDRGFVCVIAHVRGGEELGRDWYDGGRLANKMNSFHDFIDVSEWLLQQGYAAKRCGLHRELPRRNIEGALYPA